ncbi:MAG: aldo/keto reductase, partial [Pseudomonadota bacterium]
MHTRTIGPLTVSAIGLGCMNMSMGYGEATDAESEALLHAALDTGYTLLDTAALYGGGHNEQLIGRALKHRRHEYVLATKGGFTRAADGKATINGRPEALRRDCEASLVRLGTDVLDLYYVHRLDTDVPVEETTGALADLKAAG